MHEEEGFSIHRGVLGDRDLISLRQETDRLQKAEDKACVRRLGSKSPRLLNLATDTSLLRLLPAGLVPVRGILFDKTPAENWPVAWHQDLTIIVSSQQEIEGYGPWSVKDGTIHVQPPVEVLRAMRTLRIHLDDTPPENGALRVIPGSHRHGRLDHEDIQALTKQPAATCACAPGDVLTMSPLILHASTRSRVPARRRVIHFEYADPSTLHPSLEFEEHVQPSEA